MKKELCAFRRRTFQVGGSVGICIPSEIAQFLDIKPGDYFELQAEKGKYGKYISAWKMEPTQPENEENNDTKPTEVSDGIVEPQKESD